MSQPHDPEPIDMLADLTRTHQHGEPFTIHKGKTSITKNHITHVPALVLQLLNAQPAGSGEMSGATATSRPAAHIESLDTLMLIDDEAARWVRKLGEDDPGDKIDHTTGLPISGSGTIRCLRKLAGLWPNIAHCTRTHGAKPSEKNHHTWCCTRHQLDNDIRRWWRQARIISGWDTAAYRPWATCPICEHRGGLRINLQLQSAFCVECRETWDPTTIGILAQHIRTENGSDDDLAQTGT